MVHVRFLLRRIFARISLVLCGGRCVVHSCRTFDTTRWLLCTSHQSGHKPWDCGELERYLWFKSECAHHVAPHAEVDMMKIPACALATALDTHTDNHMSARTTGLALFIFSLLTYHLSCWSIPHSPNILRQKLFFLGNTFFFEVAVVYTGPVDACEWAESIALRGHRAVVAKVCFKCEVAPVCSDGEKRQRLGVGPERTI